MYKRSEYLPYYRIHVVTLSKPHNHRHLVQFLLKTFFFIQNHYITVIYPFLKGVIFCAYMTLADFGYPVKALWFYCSGNFILFGAPIFRF
jgi:hypothetical protein